MRWLFLILFSANCFSFGLTPITVDINTLGSASQKKFTVSNEFDDKLTVEVVPYLLEWSNGEYKIIPAEEDLLIIPDTIMIEPGDTQAVVLRYLGEPVIPQSKAYVVQFNQVVTDNNSGSENNNIVEMAMSYDAVVTVSPDSGRHDLQFVSATPLESGDWEVIIDNAGNKHAWATKSEWVISTKKGPVSISGNEISKKLDNVFFPPLSSVRTIFKVSDDMDIVDSLSIEIKNRE